MEIMVSRNAHNNPQTVNITKEDIQTIVSHFSYSIFQLEQSGDYPERSRDKAILEKLLLIQWKINIEQMD